MALTSKSIFLYGLSITAANQNIPFLNVALGLEFTAVVPTGFYSLTDLLTAIASAMNSADPSNVYTATADRTVSGGTQNRVTIATNGAFLSILFATGMTAASSIRDVIGFPHTDKTGSTSYQGSSTAGTILQTSWFAKNYSPPDINLKNFGAVNVSTTGLKEAITWSIQRFIEAEFQYESQANALVNWSPFLNWMIQQKPFDFTPQIASPSSVYSVTLEKSSADGKGLGFMMKEMLPDFPFMYTTGPFTMRVIGS